MEADKPITRSTAGPSAFPNVWAQSSTPFTSTIISFDFKRGTAGDGSQSIDRTEA
jgi:hypothetical protein